MYFLNYKIHQLVQSFDAAKFQAKQPKIHFYIILCKTFESFKSQFKNRQTTTKGESDNRCLISLEMRQSNNA